MNCEIKFKFITVCDKTHPKGKSSRLFKIIVPLEPNQHSWTPTYILYLHPLKMSGYTYVAYRKDAPNGDDNYDVILIN